MSHQQFRKKRRIVKRIVSGVFVLWVFVLGLVAESHSSQTGRTDGAIQGAVLKRLGMDSRIDSNDVGIHVENGHVKIFGMVNSLKEKQMASSITSSIEGVNSIFNSLRIKPDLNEDRRIRLGIEQLMETAGIQEADSIQVNVENGVVILKGLVSTRKDKNAIQNISENRPGVREVKNSLAVNGSERGDRDIHKDILFYLRWSPFFKKDDIHVEVREGTVKLNGHIDFLAEKTILVEDLEHIQGVERVEVKNLTIKPETISTHGS